MPVRYEISGKLLTITLDSLYTPQDMKDTFVAALNDPSFPDGARFLLDVRKSSELAKRSTEDVKAVAQFFARHSERVGRRCAIVATNPVHYGQSRMGATFAEFLGAEVRVFSDVDDAISWLDQIGVLEHGKDTK